MTYLPQRLAPKAETIKMLLLRSGNACAFPGCSEPIFNDQNILVGQCCHIEAVMPGGERYNSSLTDEDCRSYDNLLFMCHKHHIETNDVLKYPVFKLKQIKNEHEEKYREKKISIHPDYILQILSSFQQVENNIAENLEVSKRLEETQREVLNILKTKQHNQEEKDEIPVPTSEVPKVTDCFGRNNELNELNEALLKYNIIQVGGISGIGKSTLLAKVFENRSNSLWVEVSYIDGVEELLLIVNDFLIKEYQNFSVNEILIKGGNIEKSILVAISTIDAYGCIIILDGLDQNISQFEKFVELSSRQLKNGRLIISTNKLISMPLFNSSFNKEITGLSPESILSLLKSYLGPDISNELADHVYEITSGHPYLIKLIITLSKKIPLKDLLFEVSSVPLDKIEDYIKTKIYKDLTETQCRFLTFIAFLNIPFRLIALELFKTGDYKLFQSGFHELITKFLIGKHELSNHYFVHDLIRVYTKRQIPEEEVADLNFKAFEYLKSIQGSRLIIEVKELVFYALALNRNLEAKEIAHRFLNSLISRGHYYIATDFAKKLEQHSIAKEWPLIYYILGRVYRFDDKYDLALISYDKGLVCGDDKKLIAAIWFEKAAILTHYLEKNFEHATYNDIKNILLENANFPDKHIQVQALSSLGLLIARYESPESALILLRDSLEIAKKLESPINEIGCAYQCLGEVYFKLGKFEKSAEYFLEAFNEYERVKEILGLALLDGFYDLYIGYGWTLNRLKEYSTSADMFKLAASLSGSLGLKEKYQQALFYYGYHVLLSENYSESLKIISEHFEYIKKNKLLDKVDLKREFGTLMVANWYSGNILNAIRLLGIYIITCWHENKEPNFIVATIQDVNPGTSPIEALNYHCYSLIHSEGTTHDDFLMQVQVVIDQNPDLENALSKLSIVSTDDYMRYRNSNR